MNSGDPQFWMMISSIVIAVCFIVMAIVLIIIAITVKRAVKTVKRLEDRFDPLISKVNAISAQGKEMSVHFTEISANLSTATRHLAESTELIREEVAELKQLVGETALTAKDKVAMVSQTIDRTHDQVVDTTQFVQQKIVEPAREVAAIMAGVKRALEVLFAPAPKQIDRAYLDDELFIG
jgi:ABC-type transporter Mla subunit MlaD